MQSNTRFNRRKWLKNAFIGTAATALLPSKDARHLLNLWEEKSTWLAERTKDEAYWELVKSGFSLEKGLYYFNNASLGPSPGIVAEATNRFRALLDGFPSKYGWGAWNEQKEMVRAGMAACLKVDTEEIALTHNATEGMNLIASSIDLEPGDEVILGNHEHHTGVIPWKYHQERKGVKLVRPTLPLTPSDPRELVAVYKAAITPKTKVISIVHMANTNGMIMPIKEICEMAHAQGILVAVDGAQTLGMLNIDLKELGCDFYAGSCHKWLLSPKGTGVFYAKKEKQALLKPMIVCGGYQDESIRRLENYNTRNLPEVLGVGTALEYYEMMGYQDREDRIYELKHYFLEALNKEDRFVIKSPRADALSAGVITVELEGVDVQKAKASLFENAQIDCRPMRSHELNGLRISLSIFNIKKDIDYLVESMGKLIA